MLIPEYKWTDWLRVQKIGRLKELKSGVVMFNESYYFNFVNGNLEGTGYLKNVTEQNCLPSNSLWGKTMEEILELEHAAV